MIAVSLPIKAQFYDLDPMNVVWHGNYLRFFEQARSALFQHIGYDYDDMLASGYVFPIVTLQAKYVAPLTYGQAAEITASLVEWEYRLIIDYVIRASDTGVILTKGQSKQIAVRQDTGEACFACPEILIDKVKACL